MLPRLLAATAVVLGLLSGGCGPGGGPPAPGTRPLEESFEDFTTVSVSGQVELFPEAAALLAAQGAPLPALDGLTLSIEEPLRVLVNDAAAVLGTQALPADGRFSLGPLAVEPIHLSLAVGLGGEAAAARGLVRSSSVVFDTALAGGSRPRTDVVGARAWALPALLHDALSRAVGEARVRALTEGRAGTLLEAGFVLGRVVDAQGGPLAGARVVPDDPALGARILYPAADLSQVGEEGTGPSGLFVYVHSAHDAELFQLSVEGRPGYVAQNAGAARGLALLVTLRPRP